MTISKKIIGGFSSLVAVIVLLGGFSLYQFLGINGHSSNIEQGIPSLLVMQEMRERTLTNYSQVLRHVLATDPAQLAKIESSMKQVSESNSKLNKDYEEHIDNDTERALFAKYQAARSRLLETRKGVLEASGKGDKKQAIALLASSYEPALEEYQNGIMSLVNYNSDDVKSLVTNIDEAAHFGITSSTIAIAAGLSIAVLVSFLITRSIRKSLARVALQLADGSTQVASASSQVSASSQSLAQGASEQAASLEESSSAVEEMASMIKKNADTSQQAAVLSGEAKTAADRGTEAMDQMNAAITDIERAAGETAKIIKTIDEIAFQTNLLALNAAVEAARAGEAGKGFAVVAEEVRNLAMRSAEAAKNTSSLIEESVNKAKNGVMIAQSVGTNLQQINESTTRVSGLIAEIAAASKEQSTGIDQISSAVGQMDKVTQTNAANAEESAASSEELSAQAQQLAECVRELQMLAGASIASSQGGEPIMTRPTQQNGSVATKPARTTKTSQDAGIQPSPAKSARELIPLEGTQKSGGDFSDFSKAA